jgi:hypothetical protein
LTIDPERWRQTDPVWRSNWSAAWSRKNSIALGKQAFEFDRAYLRAILLLLAALLGVFVVVERALHPIDRAVEEVDRRPQEVVEVGFEARVLQRPNEGIEDVRDGAPDSIGLGQRPLVGLALEGAVAVKFELGEDVTGRR